MTNMKLSDLDFAPTGNKPLTNCMRWLRSCLAAGVAWNPVQREAAQQAADEAESLLGKEIPLGLGEGSPLQRIMGRYVPGAYIYVRPDEVCQLVLRESITEARLERLEAAWARYREAQAGPWMPSSSMADLLALKDAVQREFEACRREELPA
jgi:hypothetical protein